MHSTPTQADDQATLGHHVASELVPAGVLVRHGPVKGNELVDGLFHRVGGYWGELGRAVEDDVGPEVVTHDVQRGAGVAAEVLRLGPAVGDRDTGHVVVAQGVEDVG